MNAISFLIKPSSSLCNMDCRYCFYKDVVDHREIPSYNIMQEDTMLALIKQALSSYQDITFAFQGGEPTLAGLSFYRSFIEHVNQYKTNQSIHYAIQTNGLSINDEWCAFFKENHFLVGISLDGYKDNHDFLRLDAEGNPTYTKDIQAMNLLKKYGVELNVLIVLTSYLAKHPQKLFQWILKYQLHYVQFIPCLPPLQGTTRYALTPKLFASFYKTFFYDWFEEVQKGNYISITLFDNLILLFQRRRPQSCGMCGNCSFQSVIEANGNVYPCDFYALDEYVCGNIKTDNLSAMMQSDGAKAFFNSSKRTSMACLNCPFESICHQNCKRLNITYFDENYCGYKDFLEHAASRLEYLARKFY